MFAHKHRDKMLNVHRADIRVQILIFGQDFQDSRKIFVTTIMGLRARAVTFVSTTCGDPLIMTRDLKSRTVDADCIAILASESHKLWHV